jgi:hypothetical protein
MKIKLIAIFVVMFIGESCTKKNEVSPNDILNLLTNKKEKTWFLVETKTNGIIDIEDCEKDDSIIISKLKETITTNLGKKKCYDSEEIEILAFKLSNGNKIITIDGSNFDIIEITATSLILSTNEDGDIYHITLKSNI